MKAILVYVLTGAFILSTAIGPVSTYGQLTPSTPPPPGQVLFPPQELDRLLAPIALYPDPLLAQILMASTYPLEVVQAARWVREPGNAALEGNALMAALDNQSWAPSVKALVPFPQVLQMMDDRLEWMQKVGDAFLAQEGDVMAAVQRLRHLALASGTLKSTAQQTIISQGNTIVIEPANPQVIYVPAYNPFIVYGAWPYPAYPPLYFPPPPGYYVVPPVSAGFYFTVGIVSVQLLWGWNHFDWHRHRIDIDAQRFNAINTHRPPVSHGYWQHERYHRRSVPYPSPAVRERFEGPRPPPFDKRRDYRGYERVTPPPTTPYSRVQRHTPQQPAAPPRNQQQRRSPQQPYVPEVTPNRIPHQAQPRPAVPEARAGRVPRQAPPSSWVPRTGPPAFEGYGNGSEIRRESERGRTSRQSRASAGTARSRNFAPSPGSGHGGQPGARSRPEGSGRRR